MKMQANPQELFDEGIKLFNRQEYFRCHEVLEAVWTPAKQPERWFLQSLIHFAVGLYHYQCGNSEGACRQLAKGLRKIREYLPEWGGVRTDRIEHELQRCLTLIQAGEEIVQFPNIEQIAPYRAESEAGELCD